MTPSEKQAELLRKSQERKWEMEPLFSQIKNPPLDSN